MTSAIASRLNLLEDEVRMLNTHEQERHSATQPQSEVSPNRIMLFDLDYRGHHAGYLQHLICYWRDHHLPGSLDLLVSQTFLEKHSQIVALGTNWPDDSGRHHAIRFTAITDREQAALVESAELEYSFSGRIRRAFQEWQLLQKYTRQLGTTHCLIMYLDTVLLRLALGSKLPCPFSCIYFRPIFHYAQFANYRPAGKERLWQWRDRLCLTRFLGSPQLHSLFCLDPLAIDPINQLAAQSRRALPNSLPNSLSNPLPKALPNPLPKALPKAQYLPDPVQVASQPEVDAATLRQTLEIWPDRKVCLLFGVLSERKGTHQLLAAIEKLSPDLCQQLCFLLIGPSPSDQQQWLAARVAQITTFRPVQIIYRHSFVADHNVQPYFQLADLVLAPYQRHIGMSAILVRAAAAQKPVLSADFGLMGEITRRHQLGLTVDATDPDAIAHALSQFVTAPIAQLASVTQMQQFAAQNRAERFASQIFQQILSPELQPIQSAQANQANQSTTGRPADSMALNQFDA
jgi:glycosyltransferase involved in cell wall biosynthesis